MEVDSTSVEAEAAAAMAEAQLGAMREANKGSAGGLVITSTLTLTRP